MSESSATGQTVAKPKREVKWLDCYNCTSERLRHKVLHKETCSLDEYVEYRETYCIVRCCGCLVLSFYSEQAGEDFFDVVEDENGERNLESVPSTKHVNIRQLSIDHLTLKNLQKKVLLPAAVSEEKPKIESLDSLQNEKDLPEKVKAIYLETKKAHEHKLPILASVGLRTILEAVLKEHFHVADDSFVNLQDLLQKFSKLHELNETVSNALVDVVRWSNEAPHNVNPIPFDIFVASWKYVMGVIQYTILLTLQAKNIPAKPPKGKKGKKAEEI